MEEKTDLFGKFKLVRRRSHPAVKIVAIVAIVFSMLAVVAMSWVRAGVQDRTQQLRAEAARLEQENTQLTNKIAILGSVQGVRLIAEEELGLVDPDTVIIDTE